MKVIKFSALFYLALAAIQAFGMQQDNNSPMMGTQSANISPVTRLANLTISSTSPVYAHTGISPFIPAVTMLQTAQPSSIQTLNTAKTNAEYDNDSDTSSSSSEGISWKKLSTRMLENYQALFSESSQNTQSPCKNMPPRKKVKFTTHVENSDDFSSSSSDDDDDDDDDSSEGSVDSDVMRYEQHKHYRPGIIRQSYQSK